MKTPIAELSRDQRFVIYQKALDVCTKNDSDDHRTITFQLCILLPCLHWELKKQERLEK